jgi:hypothetical protein
VLAVDVPANRMRRSNQLGQIHKRELAGTDRVIRACLAFAHRGLGEGVEDICGVDGAEALSGRHR